MRFNNNYFYVACRKRQPHTSLGITKIVYNSRKCHLLKSLHSNRHMVKYVYMNDARNLIILCSRRLFLAHFLLAHFEMCKRL